MSEAFALNSVGRRSLRGPTVTGFAVLLDTVRPAVDQRLTTLWNAQLQQWRSDGLAVQGPLQAAFDLCLRGGKRLRAGLVAASYSACCEAERGQPLSLEPIWPVCSAVELLQSYFLIHDDWMDGDNERRGGPSVHAKLRQHFASEHLAAAGGILAGDFTLALACGELARAPLPDVRRADLLELFSKMQLDAVAGQLLDVLEPEPPVQRVYALKTGSYTVVGPLALGAAAAGCRDTWFESLQEYGEALGVAFQLQDDLIGLFADEAVSGKPRGSDLKAGKQTGVYRVAKARASERESRAIDGVFGNAEASKSQLLEAIAAIEASGARQEVRRQIEQLVAQAQALVQQSRSLTPLGRNLLSDVARALTSREY